MRNGLVLVFALGALSTSGLIPALSVGAPPIDSEWPKVKVVAPVGLDRIGYPVRRTVRQDGIRVALHYGRGGLAPAPDPALEVRPAASTLRFIDAADALGERFCGEGNVGCGAVLNRHGRPQLAVGNQTHAGLPEIGLPMHSVGAHCCFFALGFWVDPNGGGPGEPRWRAIRAFSGSNWVRSVDSRTPTFEVGDWRFEYAFTFYAGSWRPRSRIRLSVSRDGSRAAWRDATPRSYLRAQLRSVDRAIARADRYGSRDGLEGTMPAKAALLLRLGRVAEARATLQAYGRAFGPAKAVRAKHKLRQWGYWPRRAQGRSVAVVSSTVAVPPLARWRAKVELNRALRHEFGASFARGSGKRRDCRRASRRMFRCKVAWFIGDVTFHGRVRVWRNRRTGGVHARYVVRAIDQYCRYVTHDPPCADTNSGSS